MNLLLIATEELSDDQSVCVTGRRARHLLEVLRVEPGRSVRIGIVRGPLGTARVTHTTTGSVTLEVRLEATPPPPPSVDLVLALPRPKALSRVLQSIAALGARRLDLVNAWRVDKNYLDSERLLPERVEHDSWLGCEQGVTTWVPEIRVHRLFREFVEGELSERVAEPQVTGIVAHPYDALPLERALANPGGRTVAAVGPEGGWIDPELQTLSRCGFARVCFSERILRVESAVPALLAQLELLRRLRQ